MRKCAAGALLGVIALRLALLAGAGDSVEKWVREITADGSLISATLRLELGSGEKAEQPETTPVRDDDSAVRTMQVVVTAQPENTPEPVSSPEPDIAAADLSGNVELKNDTGFDVDLDALAAEGLDMRLKKGEPQVLIIHTHSSEAYAQEPFDTYEESDPGRTEDKSHSVIRVGDELEKKLEEHGLTVIHDRELYDYPSYTGSYTRAGAAIESYLADYPSIEIVIDLHRDAIGTGDTVYKTRAEVAGQSCAQVMLLIGTGENGLYHPAWRENLKLALYMQRAADEKCPTLMRPIALKPERYNQQLTQGSMIIEVGSSGNTLSEALLAIDLFGDAVGKALGELVEE